MFLLFIFYNLLISTSFHLIYPRISIIIPIYNVNKYLRECLDSIINQTLKTIEIICVNDGSTDNSLEILMQYKYDKRIIIINKTNSGYGDSMNQGIEFVSGQYIGIVESDDFADIHMFEGLYKYTKNNSIDMVRSNYYFYWREKKIRGHRFRVINKLYNKIFNPILNPKIFYILPSIWAGIYKKELIIKNNIKFLSTPGASFQDI
jgi:glycosyltransferase involved in cell wall biosynthesis